ncbi:hypothetical protein COEREDRAFT_90209 [Coemansia reversa NRRL 1564]|uniref:Uncharacterized protein n=1 Tax=Coemansia reversa (strain ATCC 12441 / NRRL 1564) TaxID=763665 RepID=A0A2G5B184_COERN|nr:hypothetical protein COEREDRAFT_90209 [Coemansia reversa NRRL 1564]|eukprot:PIA12477.1 hypothetical protein COEREDRAFT_90209 [Coemansia reversa NRRL 1564]
MPSNKELYALDLQLQGQVSAHRLSTDVILAPLPPYFHNAPPLAFAAPIVDRERTRFIQSIPRAREHGYKVPPLGTVRLGASMRQQDAADRQLMYRYTATLRLLDYAAARISRGSLDHGGPDSAYSQNDHRTARVYVAANVPPPPRANAHPTHDQPLWRG